MEEFKKTTELFRYTYEDGSTEYERRLAGDFTILELKSRMLSYNKLSEDHPEMNMKKVVDVALVIDPIVDALFFKAWEELVSRSIYLRPDLSAATALLEAGKYIGEYFGRPHVFRVQYESQGSEYIDLIFNETEEGFEFWSLHKGCIVKSQPKKS